MGSSPPQYQQPPDDPAYDALKAQAQQDQVTALQQRTQMDSASLMARYGTRLTMAAAGGASAAPAAATSPTMAAPLPGAGGIWTPTAVNAVFGGKAVA